MYLRWCSRIVERTRSATAADAPLAVSVSCSSSQKLRRLASSCALVGAAAAAAAAAVSAAADADDAALLAVDGVAVARGAAAVRNAEPQYVAHGRITRGYFASSVSNSSLEISIFPIFSFFAAPLTTRVSFRTQHTEECTRRLARRRIFLIALYLRVSVSPSSPPRPRRIHPTLRQALPV